jgi:glutamyl-tRNA synthetase
VLNEQGEKMSKRHGAKPVMQYRDDGFLADAVVNYLARLGWSHGDDEIFSREQLVAWFNLDHLGRSAGQFDETKLRWVNAQHLKTTPDATLAQLAVEQLRRRGVEAPADDVMARRCALFKDRCATTVELADWMQVYVSNVHPKPEDVAAHVTPAVMPALATLAGKLGSAEWTKAAIGAAIKETLAVHGLKMPQLAMALRVLVCGTPQTPSIDAVLELFPRETVIARLSRA